MLKSQELDKISRAGVEGPGPAAYNLTPFSLGKQVKAGRLRSAPQWGFGTGSTEFGSSFASQKVRSPGPAAYNFNLNTYDEVPKAGFGTATRVQALKTSVPPKGWESPGPIYGAPDPQSSACQEKRPATYSFGTGSRFSWYKEKPRRPDKSGKARPTFSEGPEAQRKGVMGPLEIGTLQPQTLQDLLRALRPGEICSPKIVGDWHVLLRLEQLTPAKFDDQLRLRMQDEALNEFLDIRVKKILAGEAAQLEPLHYDREA